MPLDTQNIKALHSVAKSQGLPDDTLLDITRKIELGKNEKEKFILIKCLIPEKKIPEEVFCRMTGFLSPSNKGISMELKLEVLKWMISAYSFLETFSGKFRYFYHFFFTLLQCDLLRPYVCNLLWFMTLKSQLVAGRHVGVIVTLMDKYGKEPCLLMLLKLYCIISPKYFETTDLDFGEYHLESLGVYPSLLKSVHPSYKLVFQTTHTSVEKTDNSKILKIGSFPEMHKRVVALKVSKSVSEILNSKYRRLFLTSDDVQNTALKVYDYVLTATYLDLNSSKNLGMILKIVQETQHSFPGIADLTEKLILSWDKDSNTDGVIHLLQYEPICCVDGFKNKMCHFREILLKSDVPVKCQLLSCLSKLYVNWVLLEENLVVSCDGRFCASDDCSTDVQLAHYATMEINKLGTYIDCICNDIISQDCNTWLINEILLHYDRVSCAHSSQKTHSMKTLSVHIPTHPVFHLSLFSLTACTLESFCRLLKRLAAECKHMQKEGNLLVGNAIHKFQKCQLSLQFVLLGKSCEKDDNFYSSPTTIISKVKEKCPNFESSFILEKHPAILFTTLSSSKSVTLESSNRESDQDRFKNHIKLLNENRYISISTLLCHRYE